MKTTRARELVALTFAALTTSWASGTAFAQANPTFVYAKPGEAKPDEAKPGSSEPPPPAVEWKAQVKGGYTMTSGNSETTGAVLGGTTSRKQGNNKLGLDAGFAYGKSSVLAAQPGTDPATGMPAITGITRNDVTTTNNWFTKGRYDRFFTTNNSGYVSGEAAADQVAGKSFFGGGQLGYSRQAYKSPMHLAVAELGYDFSYERYVQVPMMTHDPVSIHSARLFVGETLKLSSETGITASVEALFNLNKEGNALNASYTTMDVTGVDPFKDTRINGKLGLTTTLYKRLSIAFGFTLKYDQNPAPLPLPPLPPGTPAGVSYASDFVPFADKVDTLTEATLIYTFL